MKIIPVRLSIPEKAVTRSTIEISKTRSSGWRKSGICIAFLVEIVLIVHQLRTFLLEVPSTRRARAVHAVILFLKTINELSRVMKERTQPELRDDQDDTQPVDPSGSRQRNPCNVTDFIRMEARAFISEHTARRNIAFPSTRTMVR
ncbi:MAG: hypothetical protein Q9184_001905 [Pyrenodesmia sp. 2 TL-2023]